MIKIDLDNRYGAVSNRNGDRYEFTPTPLRKSEANYINIPLSIILDDEIDIRRVAVFSFLRCHCGINNIVNFTVSDIVEWCGNKPDKGAKGINNKFLNVIDALNDRGYLTYLNEPSRTSYMKCEFDSDIYYEECQDRFAVIYLDEIEKILNYKKQNSKDARLTNTTILLVFAFLRANIYKRPNKMEYGYGSHAADVDNRRLRNPEAYNDSFKNISNKIGVSEKTLAKVIDILEDELNLIVTDKAYRIKNNKGEYRTPHTIFANAYKREKKNLLAAGEEYSRAEIEAKAEKIKHEFNIDYEIDKRKRKIKKGAD